MLKLFPRSKKNRWN